MRAFSFTLCFICVGSSLLSSCAISVKQRPLTLTSLAAEFRCEDGAWQSVRTADNQPFSSQAACAAYFDSRG